MIHLDTIHLLQRWYAAHKAAEPNAQQIIDAKTAEECARVVEVCAARMKDIEKVDKELQKLIELPAEEVPPLVSLFLQVERCCDDCRYKELPHQHPECRKKDMEWFTHFEALKSYVGHLYVKCVFLWT